MPLPAKDVQCDCGNPMVIQMKRDWCRQCGQPVYYDAQAKRRDKLNRVYLTTMILLAFSFMAFLFVEMIAVPIITLQ
jgi:hypothetical protein